MRARERAGGWARKGRAGPTAREESERGVYTFALYHVLSWLRSCFFFCNDFQNARTRRVRVTSPRRGTRSAIQEAGRDRDDPDCLRIAAVLVCRDSSARWRARGSLFASETAVVARSPAASIGNRWKPAYPIDEIAISASVGRAVHRSPSRSISLVISFSSSRSLRRDKVKVYLVAVLNSLRHFSFEPRRQSPAARRSRKEIGLAPSSFPPPLLSRYRGRLTFRAIRAADRMRQFRANFEEPAGKLRSAIAGPPLRIYFRLTV